MRKPSRARATTATPTRRDLVAALAAAGILAAIPASARADGAGEAIDGKAPLAIPEGKGRVVLKVYSPPETYRVIVDGRELAPVEIMAVPSVPAPADAGADAAPPPSSPIDGTSRIAFDVEPGPHEITVSYPGQPSLSLLVKADAGSEVETLVGPPRIPEPLGGVPPVEPHYGGCCGGARATLAARDAEDTPALGAAAAVVAALLLRRRH